METNENKIKALKELSLGKEDFEKLCEELLKLKNEGRNELSLLEIMEELYKRRDNLRLNKYFKQIYWVCGKPFDILLERDILLLQISNLLISNEKGLEIKI